MDEVMEQKIRSAAELGQVANCVTHLKPEEIGALLDEIDQLRSERDELAHIAKKHFDYIQRGSNGTTKKEREEGYRLAMGTLFELGALADLIILGGRLVVDIGGE